uniref:Protein kinase domain-containing protein n=1 Tax=Alexandrium catenella TaxID=2925 RepID=A0A7S1WJW3_ALECA
MIYQYSGAKIVPPQVQVLSRSPSVLPPHSGAQTASYLPPPERPQVQAAGGVPALGMAQCSSQAGIAASPAVSKPGGHGSPPVQIQSARTGKGSAKVPAKEPVVMRVVPTPVRSAGVLPWSVECAIRLCSEGEEAAFMGRARLLDQHAITSLRDAVESLNRRLVWCPEDCCIVFSAADRSYHLLFRRDRREAAFATLGLRKSERREEPVGSGVVSGSPQRGVLHGRVALAEGGARSSAPSAEVSRQSSTAGIAPVGSYPDVERPPPAPRQLRAGPAHSYTPASAPCTAPVLPGAPSTARGAGQAVPVCQARSYQPPSTAACLPPAPVAAPVPAVAAPVPTMAMPAFAQRQATPREALERGLTAPEKIKYSDLEFIEALGSGEFGQVFRGSYRNEEVAIKQLYWDNTMTELVMEDLAKEIESFRHLRHKRLVRFIGACLEMPHLCLVTEYMPGGSLHHLLHVRKLQLPRLHSANMCLQVADGVMYLHAQTPTIVHRDLKSLNIVLDLNLNIKICDFGLTEPMERTHITKKNNGGSPRYMAPELFDSKTKITEKIDVWAMGCIFVEILGGPLPYEDISTLADLTREMLVHRRAPDVPEYIPQEMRRIICSCLDFDYRLRPSGKAAFEQLRVAKKLMRDARLL